MTNNSVTFPEFPWTKLSKSPLINYKPRLITIVFFPVICIYHILQLLKKDPSVYPNNIKKHNEAHRLFFNLVYQKLCILHIKFTGIVYNYSTIVAQTLNRYMLFVVCSWKDLPNHKKHELIWGSNADYKRKHQILK